MQTKPYTDINTAYLSVTSLRSKPLQSAIDDERYKQYPYQPFSPLHSGQATAISPRVTRSSIVQFFQSPPFGASHCNGHRSPSELSPMDLSVPSIRGKP